SADHGVRVRAHRLLFNRVVAAGRHRGAHPGVDGDGCAPHRGPRHRGGRVRQLLRRSSRYGKRGVMNTLATLTDALTLVMSVDAYTVIMEFDGYTGGAT